MSAFRAFWSHYRDYRWAGAYYGHLVCVMRERIGAKRRSGRKITKNHQAVLGRELRERVSDPNQPPRAITSVIQELIEQADTFRDRVTAGRVFQPLTSPWHEDPAAYPFDDLGEEPDLEHTDAARNGRQRLQRGDAARQRVLEVLGIPDVVKDQIRHTLNHLGREMPAKEVERTRDTVLRDGHFIEGCYAAKTFNSIDECVARLRKRHGDDDQIPDADLRRVIAGRYRQRQLTLLGKFGGLTNGVLERWWGRQHVKQKLTVPDTSGEGSGRGAVRLPGQADEEGGVSVQIGGADEDAALYERQECFQAKLRQFTPEQQAVIRGLLNRLDQGEDRDAAVADVAADHGLSQDAAWTLFEAYGRAIQECLGGS